MIKNFFILFATCPKIFQFPQIRQLTSQVMQQMIPNVTRFNDTIRILGQNPGIMTLSGTNSYLIGNSQRRLLLDTTDSNKIEYVKILEQVLNEENAKITDVVITHWHHDHIGALKDLRDMKIIDNDCKVWKYPRSDAKEDFDDLKLLKLTDNHEFVVDGDTKLQVVFTPGHTTDHVILVNKNDKTVYSGDCILGEGTAVFEDLFDYMKSLEKILELKPEKIYPGHGNVVTGAMEKIQYYISHRQQRERQILEVLSSNSPLTIMSMVQVIYKETPEHLWMAAAVNVKHHLSKLKKEEKVDSFKKDSEEYWRILTQNNKL